MDRFVIAGVGLLVLVIGVMGVAHYSLRARLAQCQSWTKTLEDKIDRQNAAVKELEDKAAAAARRGAQARVKAAGVVVAAKRSADSLERDLGAPRPATACPALDALEVVRADLAGRQ